jgi:hypothetical protein
MSFWSSHDVMYINRFISNFGMWVRMLYGLFPSPSLRYVKIFFLSFPLFVFPAFRFNSSREVRECGKHEVQDRVVKARIFSSVVQYLGSDWAGKSPHWLREPHSKWVVACFFDGTCHERLERVCLVQGRNRQKKRSWIREKTPHSRWKM